MKTQSQQSPLICYMLGKICKQRNKSEEAQQYLTQALNLMPCLWSAWLELAPMLD
jgi:uncharacterized protein HemY